MEREPFEAPAPGDPRSTGPRPSATWRDAAWAALAVALVGLTAFQLVRLAYLAATAEAAPSGLGLLLAFVITVVWLLTVYWVSAGAWRRTVWGCPFEHTADAPRLRRCARHRTVDAGDAAADDDTTARGGDGAPNDAGGPPGAP